MIKKLTRKTFSLFKNLEENVQAIKDIDHSVSITLGPTGKNGISSLMGTNEKLGPELKIITSGSKLIKILEFPQTSANVIVELIQQAASRTFEVSLEMVQQLQFFSCQFITVNITKILIEWI